MPRKQQYIIALSIALAFFGPVYALLLENILGANFIVQIATAACFVIVAAVAVLLGRIRGRTFF